MQAAFLAVTRKAQCLGVSTQSFVFCLLCSFKRCSLDRSSHFSSLTLAECVSIRLSIAHSVRLFALVLVDIWKRSIGRRVVLVLVLVLVMASLLVQAYLLSRVGLWVIRHVAGGVPLRQLRVRFVLCCVTVHVQVVTRSSRSWTHRHRKLVFLHGHVLLRVLSARISNRVGHVILHRTTSRAASHFVTRLHHV